MISSGGCLGFHCPFLVAPSHDTSTARVTHSSTRGQGGLEVLGTEARGAGRGQAALTLRIKHALIQPSGRRGSSGFLPFFFFFFPSFLKLIFCLAL